MKNIQDCTFARQITQSISGQPNLIDTLQRRHTNSQNTHDKMFDIIFNQGNANQNHTEILSNPSLNDHKK